MKRQNRVDDRIPEHSSHETFEALTDIGLKKVSCFLSRVVEVVGEK